MKGSAARSVMLALLVSVGGASAAWATEAYTTSSTWLRTGPDTNFPRIERIPRESLVEVYGCTENYDWCDIDFEGDRGWLPGRRLQFVYNGRRGSIDTLAPFLGLMILQFSLQDYWGNHYRERPWYTNRNLQRWQNWQPPHPDVQNRPAPRHEGPGYPQNQPFQGQQPRIDIPSPQQNTPRQNAPRDQRPTPNPVQPGQPVVPQRPAAPVTPQEPAKPLIEQRPAVVPNAQPTTPKFEPRHQGQETRPQRQEPSFQRQAPSPQRQEPSPQRQPMPQQNQEPRQGKEQPKKKICIPPEVCN